MRLATRKDFAIVSIIGILFGLLLVPILENIRPAFWQFNFLNTAALMVGFGIFANFALWIGSLLGVKVFGIWQFVKYAAVGSLNSLLDIGILNLFSFIFKIYSGPALALFNIISLSIAITNSYLLNKFWAFKNGTPAHFWESVKFIAVSAATILVNTAIIYFLTTVLDAPTGISPPLWENIAKLIALPVIIILNFFGYKLIVFTPRRGTLNENIV